MANVAWRPQPRQAALMARFEDEALYGGAAGGGKSDCALAEALRQVEIPYYRGLILRKTFPQLTELMDRSTEIYKRAYKRARFNDSKHVWTFPSGAKIFFGSMQHTKDRTNYQGKRYDFIDFDELTQFLWEEYSYMFSRNRPNGPGTRCYMRAQANPGGVGHGWVKERFITAGKPMETIWEQVKIRYPDGHEETRWKSRIFVPSSVFDNAILLRNDPDYLTRLASMPEQERNALLYTEARRRADELARKLVEHAVVEDTEAYDDYSGLRQYLRTTPLSISEEDSSNIPDYGDFRRRNFGRIHLRKGPTNIDQVYQELSELWPEFFDEARESHPADQLVHIAEVLDGIYQVTERNPFAAYLSESVADASNEILERFFDLPQTRRTFADRAAARLDAGRARGRRRSISYIRL